MQAARLATLHPDHRIDGDIVRSRDGAALARIDAEGSRVVWDLERLGVPSELRQLVQDEASCWDQWADAGGNAFARRLDPARLDLARWLRRFPEFAAVLDRLGRTLTLRDRTLLNIGGTGRDLVYWLNEHPRHIDQVEVSPRSQALCRRKVALFERSTGADVPLMFHTVPAEYLPFGDETYDFVFARSTIHHCSRPKVFTEIARVLKPGGLLLLSEFALGDPLYALMRMHRRVRGLDRGSDDPLRPRELERLAALLRARGATIATVPMAPVYRYFDRRNPARRSPAWAAMKTVFAAAA